MEEEFEEFVFQETVYPLIYQTLQSDYAKQMAEETVKTISAYYEFVESLKEHLDGVKAGHVEKSLNEAYSTKAIGVDAGFNGKDCYFAYIPIYAAIAVYCEGFSILDRPIVRYPSRPSPIFQPEPDIEESLLHLESQYRVALDALKEWEDAQIIMFDGPLVPYRPYLKLTRTYKNLLRMCAYLIRVCEENGIFLVGVVKRTRTRKISRFFPVCFKCEKRNNCPYYLDGRIGTLLKNCETYRSFAEKLAPMLCSRFCEHFDAESKSCKLGRKVEDCKEFASIIARHGFYGLGRDAALLAPFLEAGDFTVDWLRREDRGLREVLSASFEQKDTELRQEIESVHSFYFKCKFFPFRIEIPDYCFDKREKILSVLYAYSEKFPIPYPIYEADALTKITNFVSDECYLAFRREAFKAMLKHPKLKDAPFRKLLELMYGGRLGTWIKKLPREKELEGKLL